MPLYKTYNRMVRKSTGKPVGRRYLNFSELRAKNLEEARRKAIQDNEKWNRLKMNRTNTIKTKLVQIQRRTPPRTARKKRRQNCNIFGF